MSQVHATPRVSQGTEAIHGAKPANPWEALRRAFHAPRTRIYAQVQGAVYVLIVVSIALFAQELLLGREGQLGAVLDALDQAILYVFIVELALRVATFHPPEVDFYDHGLLGRVRAHITGRVRFLFLSPMPLIDLLTVLAVAPVFRGLRALRLLRLLRGRYSSPFSSIARAFEENALLIGFGFSFFGTLVVLGGLSIFLIERNPNPGINTLSDGVWWSMVTLTTVGFGDITPVTGLGRAVGGVLMIGGMATLALLAGIVGQSLLHSVMAIREEQFRMSNYHEHIVLFGFEPGTRMLLDSLGDELDLDTQVVVVMGPGERPLDLPSAFMWMSGDPTKESELHKVRLQYASAVIIAGSRVALPQQADATTILTAFTIRSYLQKNPVDRKRELYVVAEILDAENVNHAYSAGVDEVIETTRIGFSLVAHAVRMPGTARIMGRLADVRHHSLYVGRRPVPESGPVATVAFGELSAALRAGHGILVVGVRSAQGVDKLDPGDDYPVKADDLIVYLAKEPVLDPA